MAETTNLNISIDKDLREKIPFELSIAPDTFYSATNLAVLRKSIREANEGRFVVKTIDELRAMEE